MNRRVNLQMRDLLEHVTCKLCNGYYVDATTVVECLHSFCRTCIVQYLADNKSCPVCGIQIHKTRPLLNIKHDQTLQDIVYTLVPGLHKNEMKRRKQFWMGRDDLALWKHSAPEDLGELEDSDAKRKEQSKKICLSIEPSPMLKNKLSTDSEWMEIDKPISKRFIRCSQDVSIYHLSKFLRIKLRERDETMILFFLKGNVLQESFTLSDILETSPCKFNESLALSYGVYSSKQAKRDILQSVSNSTVPARMKRRLPSATPQLQAFFNSQLNPPSNKADDVKPAPTNVEEKCAKIENELARDQPSISTKTKNSIETSPLGDADRNVLENNMNPPKPIRSLNSIPLSSSVPTLQIKVPEPEVTIVGKPPSTSAINNAVPALLGIPQVDKKQTDFMQNNQVPMPTSSESISSNHFALEQSFNKNFLKPQHLSDPKPPPPAGSKLISSEVKAPKNRRKASKPVQHAPASFSKPIMNYEESPIDNPPKISSPQQSGKFILLSTPKSKFNVRQTSDQGLNIPPTSNPRKRAVPGLDVPILTSAVAPNLSVTTLSSSQSVTPTPESKRSLGTSYEGLSNAQAHLRALDTARSVMQTSSKRPLPSARPILPKTTNSSSYSRKFTDANIAPPSKKSVEKVPGSKQVHKIKSYPRNKFNISQTGPVHPIKHSVPRSVPLIRPKESVSNSLTAPSQRQAVSTSFNNYNVRQLNRTFSLDRPPEFLDKISVANSAKKKPSNVAWNKPPPPYSQAVSSIVHSSTVNKPAICRGQTPNSSRTNSSKTFTNSSSNKMLALTGHPGQRFSSPSIASSQPPHRNDVFTHSPRHSGVTASKKHSSNTRFSSPASAGLRPIAPHIKGSRNVDSSYNPIFSQFFTGFRKGYSVPSVPTRSDMLQPHHPRYSTPPSKPRENQPFVRLTKSSKPKTSHGIASGASGSFIVPSSSPHRSEHNFRAPTAISSYSHRPSFNRPFTRSPEKRNIHTRDIPVSPPVGTKSPWSSRGIFLPPTEADPLPYIPTKKPRLNSFDQSGDIVRPPFTAASSGADSQPLELTVKSGKSLNPPFKVLSQSKPEATSSSDSEQPLCLIVKKQRP